MKVFGFLAVGACLFMGVQSARADGADGNQLLVDCEASLEFKAGNPDNVSPYDAAMCLGYISGVRDILDMLRVQTNASQPETHLCIPSEATYGQLTRVVVKFLQDNPARLHEHPVVLTFAALEHSFGCM